MSDQLTAFQVTAERELGAFLKERHRAIERRDVLHGTIPFFSRDPQTAVRLRSGDLEVLLFDDEATYSIQGRSEGFERADFNSTDDLLGALMKRLRTDLER
jgi:hypothetical protein